MFNNNPFNTFNLKSKLFNKFNKSNKFNNLSKDNPELNTSPLKEKLSNTNLSKKLTLTTKLLNTKKNTFPELFTTLLKNKFPSPELNTSPSKEPNTLPKKEPTWFLNLDKSPLPNTTKLKSKLTDPPFPFYPKELKFLNPSNKPSKLLKLSNNNPSSLLKLSKPPYNYNLLKPELSEPESLLLKSNKIN